MATVPPKPPVPRHNARYYSKQQLARRYGVSKKTIWSWTKLGILPKGEKLGYRTLRWRDDTLEQFEYLRRMQLTFK